MNKFILFICSAVGMLILISSFRSQNNQYKSPIQYIEKDFHINLDQLNTNLATYRKELQASSELNQDLKNAYLDLRRSYKKVEHLMSFLDGEYVINYINGAPLPKQEKNASSIRILEPKGLQIIEELIFSDEYSKNKNKIVGLSEQLQKNVAEASKLMQIFPLTHRHFFESVRLHMIRVFALGVSGFDSPNQFSIQDAATSFQEISKEYNYYFDLLSQREPQLAESIANNLKEATNYLKTNQDFVKFDRLTFLTQYINPLYSKFLKAQNALGIETVYEITPSYTKHSLNYNAENLFAKDFLDLNYYTLITEKELEDQYLIDLGETLFFDPVLSDNNERSCASCHNPKLAFTDGLAKSMAMNFAGDVGRNAPTLINVVFSDRFFYDIRKGDLEHQIDHVIFNKKELNTTYIEIMEKLATSEEYTRKFKNAFPEMKEDELITKYTISASITSYIASLIALDSPFDQYVRGEVDHIDPQVKDGFNLFMGKALCGTCHFAPTFNGLVPPMFKENETEVLGVPATPDTLSPEIDPDLGRYAGYFTARAEIYKHSFKTMTVRNIEFTAPYMHNGVYHTLEEVIDFYNKGGGIGLGLDVPHQTLPPDPLDLSDYEKESLIVFMKSLSDTTNLTSVPKKLPVFPDSLVWNNREIGGKY